MIYLDHNATTRPLPEVIATMGACQANAWANPSSRHALGQSVRAWMVAARADVAALVGAQPVEVVFTSGATEANHHALHGALHRSGAPRRVLLSAVEHAGYLASALRLREEGVEVSLLPVDACGRVSPRVLQEALRDKAALVSVMAANNETGVLQPVADLAVIARAHGVPFHVDATQCAGKLPVDFAALGADLLSLSAHKLHGPKGSGALVIRKGLSWPSLIAGRQERARRGGTENVAGIVGFGVAAQHARTALSERAARLGGLRDQLEAGLATCFGDRLLVHGHAAARLPNTSCISLAGLSAEKVLRHLERRGIFASSGAACSSGGTEPSHVLIAMGVPASVAHGAVRLSLGSETSEEEIAETLGAFASLAAEPAAVAPPPPQTNTQPTSGALA
ncbi:cysteine desulfurase family protein [Niveibacterium sp. SC-1]|uniref:cysteine desulfurase family protein n=1 Tax=Niveibacterium sp. SC-1 TaxID=3135646 RepID=UPI00311F1717